MNELVGGALVQNVSAQCIPNLVATKTFKPQKIVWLYTPQVEGEARRMGAIAAHWRPRPEQRFCQVDARDVQALDKALARALGRLAREKRPIVFHLTGGTKSMALMAWRQMRALEEKGARCYAVVMDPTEQAFDLLHPHCRNAIVRCERLDLKTILRAHGNAIAAEGRSLPRLAEIRPLLNKLRALAPTLREALAGREPRRGEHDAELVLTGGADVPEPLRRALRWMRDGGVLAALEIRKNRIRWRWAPGFGAHGSPVDYARNEWLEDWVGAVLGKLSDWDGAYVGLRVDFSGRVREHRGKQDMQEFDFLGARRNRLVYWSCKHAKALTPAMLFEVDALRDEVGGRDQHVAGLVYLSQRAPGGLEVKARRLGVHLVDVSRPDAEKTLLQFSK